MRKIPLPRIGMRTIKTAVAVTLSYLIFVPFGLLYNENYPGVLGYIGPLYACIPCVVDSFLLSCLLFFPIVIEEERNVNAFAL